MTADEIIARLGLKPHPEGGHYVETFRAPDSPRGASTAIYFLLKAGERSHWHRVDADEIWHHYAGAPLELSLSDDGRACAICGSARTSSVGEQPQAVVPRGSGRPRARSALDPGRLHRRAGFRFEGFELAPPGWEPS